MIGKAYWATFKYYDSSLHKMAFKKRPVLIIGKADERDYVILPISRVPEKNIWIYITILKCRCQIIKRFH